MQSSTTEDKECAANAIANLVNQPEAVASLLEAKIVKIAGPLMNDNSFVIRHVMTGALRNLSVSGHDVCAEMIEQDIMTPLIFLLRRYQASWLPAKSTNKRIDSKKETFIEAVNLLWNLCESSETAVSIFSKQQLLPILLQCLDIKSYGIQVCIAVAQCLHTISEDNPDVIAQLSSSNVLELIQSLMNITGEDASRLLLKILASGLILNIHFGQLTTCSPSILSSILKNLTEVLSMDASPYFNTLTEKLLLKKERIKKFKNEEDVEVKDAELDAVIFEVSDMLSALHIALENLTNICSCNDDTDSWEDTSTSSSGDSDQIANDELMEEGEPYTFEKVLNIPCELHEIVVNHTLLKKVLNYASKPPEVIQSNLVDDSHGRRILKRIHTIRCRSLLCAHNLVQCLDLEDIGGPSEAYNIWIKLAQLAFKETDSEDLQLLEASSSAARSILQKLSEGKCYGQFQKTTEGDVQLLILVGQQSPDGGIRTNIVRILAILSSLLNNTSCNDYSNILKLIGLYLLDISSKDPEIYVAAEALDALFDVFAEDNVNHLMQEISLIDKLKHLLPALKGKINHQKKTLGEHYPIVMTAKANLARFIKYKSDQQTKNGH